MGAPPPNPHENQKKQRFKPSLLPAFREQQGGKGKRKLWVLRPQTPMKIKKTKIQTLPVARVPRATGREGKKEAMGAIRPQTPNQDVGWSQWARRLG